LVYNITSKETFENLKNIWLDDVINFGEEYKVLAVVGNKCDLYEQEAVPEEEARKFAEENNAIFMNVSAKNGDNIDLLFETCVKKFFDPELHVNIRRIKDKNDDSLVIKNKHKKGKKEKEKEKKSCC
jgi:GTPase SAR1 family protein